MSSRDSILAAVRANAPKGVGAPGAIPCFERRAGSLVADFEEAAVRMGGKVAYGAQAGGFEGFIRSLFPQAEVICSAVPELKGTRALNDSVDPAELADVDIAIVRAAFGVAETGSIWLSETELRVNSLAFLAQHLVALLDPRAIVENLHHAYADPRFKTARYAVLVTGPSATADIEGVLIHGAQGVRSLTVVLMPGATAERRPHEAAPSPG
jgi:L-lactate dehydrogenase complex protein LldG